MTKLKGNIITLPDAGPVPGELVIERGHVTEIIPLPDGPEPESPYITAGFIDAHLHPLELGLERLFADLRTAGSIAELLATLRERLPAAEQCGIMLGFNLDPDTLVEKRYPSRAELDRVATDIPLLVYRVDGHSAALNSAGLALAIGQNEPAGIEQDESGRPTGVLRGRAYERASKAFKQRLNPPTIRAALREASTAALSRGVTTIAALVGNSNLDEKAWRLLLDTLSGLKTRAVPFAQTRNPKTAGQLGLPRVGGCILIDGSFGSHTAALEQKYADSPGDSGNCYLTDEELLAFIRDANALNLQTAVHAIGDRAVEQVVRSHEELTGGATANPLRHRIEHAELLSTGLIERIAELELILGVQPAFEARWGGPDGMYAERLGSRWEKTNPYRSLLDAGVILAGGSDAPITPIDPLAGIRAAVAHPNPRERISGAEAFAMFTTAAAWSLGLEMRAGRIEPGFDADLAVLSGDPRTDNDCRVLATYRAGELLFQAATRP